MKFLTIFLFIICFSFYGISDVTVTSGNNTESYNIQTLYESQFDKLTSWGGKSGNFTAKISAGSVISYLSSDESSINIKQITKDFKLYNTNYNISLTCDFKSKGGWSNGGYQIAKTSTYRTNINVIGAGQVEFGWLSCSGVAFSRSDIIKSEASSNLNGSINFIDGGGYSGLNQPSNGNSIYNYEYVCTVNGYNCFIDNFITIKTPETTVFNQGLLPSPILKTDSPILLNTYTTNTGGKPVFSGIGVTQNGDNYYLDPSLVSINNTNITISNHNGNCYNWTGVYNISITPVVDLANSHIKIWIDLINQSKNHKAIQTLSTDFDDNTFWLLKNYIISSKSNELIEFSANLFSSDPQFPYVNYEWKAIWHNKVIKTGTGETFSINTPNVDSLQPYSYYQYPVDTILKYLDFSVPLKNQSFRFNGLILNDSFPFASTDLLDPVVVLMRFRNRAGAVSNWRRFFVGMIQPPIVSKNQKICLDKELTLSTNSLTEYKNNDIRSSLFNIHNSWLTAQNDSLKISYTSLNKTSYIKTQIIDTIKIKGKTWSTQSGSSIVTYRDTLAFISDPSHILLSNIDSILIINNPKPIMTFSNMGLTSIGTAIKAKTSGNFINHTDLKTWNWSDGSETYYGDSTFHYLNDIDSYTLDLSVLDTFGCKFDTSFVNRWLVTGILSLDETINDELINFYPVPVRDILTIDSQKEILNIKILNINGELIYEDKQKKIDLSKFPSGTYFVNIEFKEGIITKKISKL